MKKFTFLVMSILLITMGSFSQNLIENPGFENWTAGQPDVWTTSGDAITLSQNTTIVQEGSSSCQVIFTSQENQNLLSNTFAVTAGDPIAVSVYVYDNDVAGRARLSILYDAGGNFYSNDYSEDMDSWQLLSHEGLVPDGATTATFQVRFYDVSASWDGNAEILVDHCNFIIDDAIKPEPSNYPTDFAASANGASANVSWTDATGDQLPQNYLVMASSTNNFTAPVDGTPVADDADLSDGTAMFSVSFGQETAAFSGVEVAATYYFTIFPYTNEGVEIDYKTDGTAPTAQLTMPDVTIINFEDFENDNLGEWVGYSVTGDQIWETAPFGNPGICAKMSGYLGAPFDNEDWLISPAFNFDNYVQESFRFETSKNYEGPDLELLISNDYISGDPNLATWESLSFTPSSGSWEWVGSGLLDLSSYNGTIHLAYKFTSTTSGSATWEVDNILLTGAEANSVNDLTSNLISVYPNPGTGIFKVENTYQTPLNIAVYNILGELVFETISSETIIQIDIQNQNNGVYLVQLIGNHMNKTISVVKR